MVSPREFFMGFSRYYNSFGIAFEESITTNTTRIISYVDKLGRMLGYRIFSELSCSNLFKLANKQCPIELKRKKPDCCWGYFTDEGNVEYELVLESEQSMKEEKIEKDVIELLFFPAKLKILYCAHSNPKRVVKMVQKVAHDRQQKEFVGDLLLIVDPWINPKTFSEGQLIGILLNLYLEGVSLGRADIATYKDGTSNIRLFKNAIWEDVNGPIIF